MTQATATKARAKAPAKAPASIPPAAPSPDAPRITKRVPRIDPVKKSAKDRALAGVYRVIHGRVCIPKPYDEIYNADGSAKVGVSKFDWAIEGDEVYLGDEDAARMLDADIVEPLDARPSRAGKVWEPPKPNRNKNSPSRGAVG